MRSEGEDCERGGKVFLLIDLQICLQFADHVWIKAESSDLINAIYGAPEFTSDSFFDTFLNCVPGSVFSLAKRVTRPFRFPASVRDEPSFGKFRQSCMKSLEDGKASSTMHTLVNNSKQ